MPDLRFAVEDVAAIPRAAVPAIGIRLRIANASGNEAVQHVALQTQIQIEPVFRPYTAGEQSRLRDLFDDPARWGVTLKTVPWTQVQAIVPAFEGATTFELPVPCSFDFNVAATKYFAALEGGEIPLRLLFSGTVFHRPPEGGLQIAPIPWDREAECRLPVDVWQRMMELYYPNEAWLSLRRDVFARLYEHKVRGAFPTWEDALSSMLDRLESPEAKP